MTISNETLERVRNVPAGDAEGRAAEADRADETTFRRHLVKEFNRRLELQGRPPSAVMLDRQQRFIDQAGAAG